MARRNPAVLRPTLFTASQPRRRGRWHWFSPPACCCGADSPTRSQRNATRRPSNSDQLRPSWFAFWPSFPGEPPPSRPCRGAPAADRFTARHSCHSGWPRSGAPLRSLLADSVPVGCQCHHRNVCTQHALREHARSSTAASLTNRHAPPLGYKSARHVALSDPSSTKTPHQAIQPTNHPPPRCSRSSTCCFSHSSRSSLLPQPRRRPCPTARTLARSRPTTRSSRSTGRRSRAARRRSKSTATISR
ncbi:hypothetical protein AMAG_08765 [Allomyces macrogynus ATCC 38327]|uniref:Uncharacterized protein n=1 Tax=Allomyces macrogynus (strain ATCC 38327) TaxID=578462 RepID=A0A0L0SMG2_ALLM3|nr:hypothetical protein AMAG_08765 [Allomyces macrogynus ATCC 38327]|eukprot:KNE63663.1 hypothetical protein AMAG_08765 [Allomyces macrogynus ATCC 38327]